jgi:carbonic anhydrase
VRVNTTAPDLPTAEATITAPGDPAERPWVPPSDLTFDDLLAANRSFAADFGLAGFDGVARAGVAMVTCMDSRIDPLRMIGLEPGDAKILRNPGGRVTDASLVALVVGVHLLQVGRILVVEHTRCTMASATEQNLRRRISEASGLDAGWMSFGTITNQRDGLAEDVARIRSHPLIPSSVAVGGFLYDVDTGLLHRLA